MKSTIQQFYNAFNELDADTMTSLYHEEVVFQDPAFGILQGDRARNLWKMLCYSQKKENFKILAYNFDATETAGKVRWEAFYTFPKTGRKIHNIVDATFSFKDGKIVHHVDTFDLYRWSKQALGAKGVFVGWTPFFRKQLNRQANQMLDRFMEKD